MSSNQQKANATISTSGTSTTSDEEPNEQAFQATLYNMTAGLPRRELNLMVSEVDECEAALLHDIQVLEKAIAAAADSDTTGSTSATTLDHAEKATVEAILQSPYTPLDRYWTVSSLLGRLRDDWMLPSILAPLDQPGDDNSSNNSRLEAPTAAPSAQASQLLQLAAATNNNNSNIMSAEQHQLLHQHYIQTYNETPPTTLLATWKKISMHRSAIVFKRPVKPEEAPGYAERIVFPMDLSMIRKLIVARHVVSYKDLHHYIALISHNCVKYNGRESDYGRVARDFEAMADDFIYQAVVAAAAGAPSSTTGGSTTDANTASEQQPPAAVSLSMETDS